MSKTIEGLEAARQIYQRKIDRETARLREKYGRDDIFVDYMPGDGFCLMIGEGIPTGILLEEFFAAEKMPGFDIDRIETYL